MCLSYILMHQRACTCSAEILGSLPALMSIPSPGLETKEYTENGTAFAVQTPSVKTVLQHF